MPAMLFRNLLVALLLLVPALPVFAEEQLPSPDQWQAVISCQIEAFRAPDAPAAFGLAGAGFQTSFPNAEVFFSTIVSSGYAPIMESASHSFGRFQLLSPVAVIQQVDLVGRSQERYTAIYQMTEEAVGWRVQGVQLVKAAGMAI